MTAIPPNPMPKNIKLINQLREFLAKEFSSRLMAATAVISSALFETSSNTDDADLKRAILGARDVWESRSSEWEAEARADYIKRFDEKLTGDDDPLSKTMKFSIDSLKLVEDDEMREEILLGNVTKRLTDACDYELFALTKRLESLAEITPLSDRQNPVVPRVFCRSLLAGLVKADTNVSQRCEILSAAQASLADILTGTFKEANELLVSHGFMIEIPARYGKPINRSIARSIGRSNAGSTANTGTGGNSNTSTGDAGSNAGQAGIGNAGAFAGGNLSDLFARLLSKMPGMGTPTSTASGDEAPPAGAYDKLLAQMLGNAGASPPIDTASAIGAGASSAAGSMVTPAGAAAPAGTAVVLDPKLIEALERFAASTAMLPPANSTGAPVQDTAPVAMPALALEGAPEATDLQPIGVTQNAVLPPSGGYTNLVRQAQPMLAQQLQPVQAVITDVVAGFFDRIFESTDIPDSIKALVGRMQIQILKASMQDPHIFTNAEHPLRRFIDQLADIGVKRQQSLVHGDPVFEQISAIVQNLHQRFDTDPKAVETAEAELAVFIQAEEESAQGVIFDSVMHVQQEEEIEMGASMAAFEIDRRLAGKVYSNDIKDFAKTQWQPVLAKDYLADGEDGAQWKSDLATLDDLLWSVEPHASKLDRPRLLKLLPTLLGRLNGGLDRVGISMETRKPYFQAMVALHTSAMRPVKTASPPEPSIENDLPMEGMPPSDPREKLRKRSVEIERGQWVEITDDEGDIQHCRLSWVSPLKETFIFKNYDTKQAITLRSDEFKSLQMNGRIKLLEEHSITERSIEGAIRGLLQKPDDTVEAGSS